MLLAVESLPRNGVYTLILFLLRETSLKIGALGTRRFPKGYYTYTGSALGLGSSSLKHRVLRHLKKKKRRFWHIDYLLGHKNVYLTGLVAAATDTRAECKINRYIKIKENGKIPVSHFGASDCKKNCGSHLLYFGQENITPKIATLYKSMLEIEHITVDFTEMV
ncbi:MAG: GIY-YIG nuclease family protein [Candidatus Bathyarchaeota archaeon]|nr:GIY-YIG nuclease family protein [Candidatus Bathyarchaeota archaeon]